MITLYKRFKVFLITLLSIFVIVAYTGCSYITDAIEGAILNRASFSIEASEIGGNVTITWSETDSSDDFAGWEIYRTVEPYDEFVSYTFVASRYVNDDGYFLDSGSTGSYTDDNAPSGIYFYRVGLIYRDTASDEDKANYPGDMDGDGWNMNDQTIYENRSHIHQISGYVKVDIP